MDNERRVLVCCGCQKQVEVNRYRIDKPETYKCHKCRGTNNEQARN